MARKAYLVTGGLGFIGAALTRRLVAGGHAVCVLDDGSRGSAERLGDARPQVEVVAADVRDAAAVAKAAKGVDAVVHLASVNGTRFFYEMPERVLEVGVKGTINVIDACLKHGVGELVVASSSEVYQQAPTLPTDERAPLAIPDPLNPRYSYAGAKIASELLALNFGRKHFRRVAVFRPHNVYGPDMGWEHVLPQFVVRMKRLAETTREGPIRFPIQGTGAETRAFCYIDDFIEGLMLVLAGGEHLGIYHIGTREEVAVAEAARLVGAFYGREVEVAPGPPAEGGAKRRCPDISKLAALGYAPKVPLSEGLPKLARWYDAHADRAPPSLLDPAGASS
jgi:dTDP-glucose 4,6-dehydratase/UDP-glucose 4-epimerase